MKVILFTTLLFFSINGFTFNWKKVAEDEDGHSLYVDVDNIQKHNGLVYYWQFTDFLEPFGTFNSAINKTKVNCGEEILTNMSGTFYSQSFGKGRILHEFTS